MRPMRMSGRSWEAHAEVRVWSGGSPDEPGGVGRHSRVARKGR